MKIKNIKKFKRSIIIIIAISVFIILLISKATLSHKEIEYKKIYVSEGDTLWSIAKFNMINNDYYKGKDITFIINNLMEINNLNTSNLNINQELSIPII